MTNIRGLWWIVRTMYRPLVHCPSAIYHRPRILLKHIMVRQTKGILCAQCAQLDAQGPPQGAPKPNGTLRGQNAGGLQAYVASACPQSQACKQALTCCLSWAPARPTGLRNERAVVARGSPMTQFRGARGANLHGVIRGASRQDVALLVCSRPFPCLPKPLHRSHCGLSHA